MEHPARLLLGIGQHEPVIDHKHVRLEIHKLAGDFFNAPFRRIAEAGVAAGVVVERVCAVGGDPSLHEVALRSRKAPLPPPVVGLRHGLPAAPDHVAGRRPLQSRWTYSPSPTVIELWAMVWRP